MENQNDAMVDMDMVEAVHADMLKDAKVMVIMMLASLQSANPEKNQKAITEAIDFCADTIAHKIAFQYAIRKGAKCLDNEAVQTSVTNGKKSMLGFSIMSQACEVHQNLREHLRPFFRDMWEKLSAHKSDNLNRFN